MPPEDQRFRSVTLNLTARQHDDLRELAVRKFSTVSQVVRELVHELVSREKRGEQADAR